jgi:hypothetical protein
LPSDGFDRGDLQGDDGPRIVYVPGDSTVNRYHPGHDAIILDETLKDYPDVHDLVKAHELEHARQHRDPDSGLLAWAKHEFRTDWLLRVSRSEDAQRARTYIRESHREGGTKRERAKGAALDIMRSTWVTLLLPIAALNRLRAALSPDIENERRESR